MTHLGLWINRRGAPRPRGVRPFANLGLGPCVGAPDSLAAALGDWDATHWLDVGASRAWELTWRAQRAPMETPI